jgi:hypothetical protein
MRGGHGRQPWLEDKDYVINTIVRSKKGAKSFAPVISLSSGTKEFVMGLLGDTVNVGINDKGLICLAPGIDRKITTTSCGDRGKINIGSEREKLARIYGPFKRLFFKAELYGNFNAVVLKPTGERE